MAKAVGLLEVLGYSVALAAMDQACKAAEVRIEAMDCNNPSSGDKASIPVVIQVKFTGNISDVRIALDVARQEACKYIADEEIVTKLISNYAPGLENLLGIGKVKLP
ncbi:BMC domain-containing protein [Gracilibacillus xinjiangensis]|uniref:BMC domain-containing protein n=1 Tax=Gracilibacillus xinjiangensis TaxID=1193282 RepID=A0ABV8WYM1_9BACI